MNVSYELINTSKEIAVSAILAAKDIFGTIYIIVDYRVGIFPFNFMLISAMLLTRCCPWCCGGKFSTYATHLMIVLQNMISLWKVIPKLTLIDSRLEVPHTNYVVQCNTVPNNNTIVNMYMIVYQDMIPFKNKKKYITC